MKPSEIIVVPKMSKYEWDMHKYNLMSVELVEKYKREGVDYNWILESHELQQEAVRRIKEVLPQSKFIARERFSREIASTAKLVVSLGGDNHFQFVSHYVDDTPLLGVNADPKSSEGALTEFSLECLENSVDRLIAGKFETEDWPKLGATVGTKRLPDATCDFYLGELRRYEMSRHILDYKGFSEVHKSSGVIVSTGAGSSGWFRSAARHLNGFGDVFERTKVEARFVVSEPYKGRLSGYELISGTIEKGERIQVRSLNDSDGKVVCDSLSEFDFGRGARAEIFLSENVLRVVQCVG